MPPRRASLLDVVLVIDRPSLPGGSCDGAAARSGSSMADSGTLRQSSTADWQQATVADVAVAEFLLIPGDRGGYTRGLLLAKSLQRGRRSYPLKGTPTSTDRLVTLGCLTAQLRRRDKLNVPKIAYIQRELAACGAN